MRPLVVVAAATCLLWVSACGKDAPAEGTSDKTEKADKSATGGDKAKTADKADKGSDKKAETEKKGSAAKVPPPSTAKPAEKASPTKGWVTNNELGFELFVPPGKPMNLDAKMPKVDGVKAGFRAWQLGASQDAMGMAISMAYGGSAAYDIEAGLDGACKGMVSNIGGKMIKLEKTKENGKSARKFSFSATVQGLTFEGMGRAIATGDRSMAVAAGFYKAGSGSAPYKAKAQAFVGGLKIK